MIKILGILLSWRDGDLMSGFIFVWLLVLALINRVYFVSRDELNYHMDYVRNGLNMKVLTYDRMPNH
jgi:hypothetical protein